MLDESPPALRPTPRRRGEIERERRLGGGPSPRCLPQNERHVGRCDRHHGEPHISLLVKTSSLDELESLIEAQPHAYHRPAYYGASGWVGVILNRPGLDWDSVAEWLERSWRAVAPPRLTKLMDAADAF